jgi:hypothetical protein
MSKKSLIIILSILFLTISSLIYPEPDQVTFADLVAYYPEILYEDLENYNYTINAHGSDFYLVTINGVTYIVQL